MPRNTTMIGEVVLDSLPPSDAWGRQCSHARASNQLFGSAIKGEQFSACEIVISVQFLPPYTPGAEFNFGRPCKTKDWKALPLACNQIT